MGDGEPLKQFLGQVAGVVDEFFHAHGRDS
jgi:hypothetical protein